MKKICINCSPLLSKITGIERFIYENIKRIDTLAESRGLSVAAIYPEGTEPVFPELRYIRKVGLARKGNKIKISAVKRYLKETDSVYFSLHGGICLYRGSVICIHDMRTWSHKQYDPLPFRLKCNINALTAKHIAAQTVTVSFYSAGEIARCLHIPKESIEVIPDGWEHIKEISPDDTIWERLPFAQKGSYYYSLSSRAPHKNFIWVEKAAERNPDKLFLIGGKPWGRTGEAHPENLHYLGYVTDEENVALMSNCKAFLHPSKYEGFGITPLEALACGADVCVSDASCLPEVFEDCVHYFDPDDYDIDLEKLTAGRVAPPDKLFQKYSWDKSARMWVALMEKYGK